MSNYEALPVAVYNADKQQLIAVFCKGRAACKFIYGNVDNHGLATQIRTKARIKPKFSIHPFDIAVRYASKTQTDDLGDGYCLIKAEEHRPVLEKLIRTHWLQKK